MPEMNENVPSGADKGLERNDGAQQEAAALLRTTATALLSAADIWSTNTVAPAQPGSVATAPAVADKAAVKTAIPEANLVEESPPTTESRRSEILAEAEFFSWRGKRGQEGQPIAKLETIDAGSVDKSAVKPPPLPLEMSDVGLAGALERHASAALGQACEQQARQSAPEPVVWPPQKLSLALQGGGSFAAFTWGVLERLLEEPACDFDCVSGASVGAINATLLACGLVQGGREGARKLLAKFWQRMTNETSFRSLMLVGGFSPAGSSVAFGSTLRSGQFDPFDLDPLREALSRDIDFASLRARECPKVLIAATRVRDGRQQIFDNAAITADVLLASTCPPLVHCAVEVDGESYWDGGYGANPPLVRLIKETAAPDVLVVQVTPAHDGYVPITAAAIDRRLDQIAANAALHAELAALEWARERGARLANIHRIAAEDEIDGLAQRNPADLGRGFMTLLHGRGRSAADRWLQGTVPARPVPVVVERAVLVPA
jgi:NTE family protein